MGRDPPATDDAREDHRDRTEGRKVPSPAWAVEGGNGSLREKENFLDGAREGKRRKSLPLNSPRRGGLSSSRTISERKERWGKKKEEGLKSAVLHKVGQALSRHGGGGAGGKRGGGGLGRDSLLFRLFEREEGLLIHRWKKGALALSSEGGEKTKRNEGLFSLLRSEERKDLWSCAWP